MTVWPSGLRRWHKAPVRKGVGSNTTAVISVPWYSFMDALDIAHHVYALLNEEARVVSNHRPLGYDLAR